MRRNTPPRRGLEIIEAVRALHEPIRAAADEIEKLGRLTDGVIDALRGAGVFGMATPESMGGPEADPLTQLEVAETLSIADASTGWVVTIGSDTGFYAAHLPEATAREMFPDPQTITASVLVPKGVARRVDGGYRASGQWPFGSAGLHAAWFGGSCIVQDDEAAESTGDAPLIRTLFFPASDVLVHDNWQTTGLAGSGSNDWSVDDVLVPEARAISIFEPARVQTPLYAFPWFVIANAPGVSLGLARASIDALVALARDKKTLAGTRLEDDLIVQTRVGHAEAELAAARHYIYAATEEMWAAVCAGDTPTLEQRAHYRIAGVHAFRTGRSVVAAMYESAGGSALYRKSPLDRYWRDSTTISQHAFANESAFGEVGRAFMGLDPKSMLI